MDVNVIRGNEGKAVAGGAGLPATIGLRTDELAPLLLKWRQRNPGVTWKHLLRCALLAYPDFRKLAGRRYAHLVAERQ